MWIFTDFGYFSVCRKEGDDYLTVRGRVKDDLERLKKKYRMPSAGPITEDGTDYEYRFRVSKRDFGDAMCWVIQDIDYAKFKDSVKKKQGYDRYELYLNVWEVLLGLIGGNWWAGKKARF